MKVYSSIKGGTGTAGGACPVVFVGEVFVRVSRDCGLVPVVLSPAMSVDRVRRVTGVVSFLVLAKKRSVRPRFCGRMVGCSCCRCGTYGPALRHSCFRVRLCDVDGSLKGSVLNVYEKVRVVGVSRKKALYRGVSACLRRSVEGSK